jgi:ferric-dicitrate binding protein FerR (iron transport regulator)
VASIVAIVLLTSVLGSIPLLQKQKVAITTQPGQIINIALPDSSSVTLNSNSSLEYHPLAFILKREIHLKGEAYFDIRKKKNIPFRVNCNTLNIKVTGTRFNVDAYDQNESYKIVLEEGSVKVKPKKDHHPAVELSPGEKLEIDKTSLKHSIEKVNTRFYTSWKEGILYFYDSTFEEVIERIGSRYGAKIIIKDDLINHFVISTTIKDEPLEKILDLFKKVLPVTINETEGTIYFHLDHERYKKFKNKSPS